MIRKNIAIFMLLSMFLLNGCAYRLFDNITVVNSKSKPAHIDQDVGKKVEGDAYYPYLIGYNLQDAIDEAIENAGSNYNMLINTTIDVKYYYALIYFSKYVMIKGTAVNSSELKERMGEEKYSKWFAEQNIFYYSETMDHHR